MVGKRSQEGRSNLEQRGTLEDQSFSRISKLGEALFCLSFLFSSSY